MKPEPKELRIPAGKEGEAGYQPRLRCKHEKAVKQKTQKNKGPQGPKKRNPDADKVQNRTPVLIKKKITWGKETAECRNSRGKGKHKKSGKKWDT